MNGKRAFLDTNIVIYFFAEHDERTKVSETLVMAGGRISVQSLNEFVAVATRKLRMPWPDIVQALDLLRVFCPSPTPITEKTHEAAIKIARRYRYHIYDSLIIAAALESGCDLLYSEDLRDGQKIEQLTIRNPFN